MPKKSLVFIGFQGVGKTFFGKKLAKLQNRIFIDIDTEIVNYYQHQFSIAEIFSLLGEEAFRNLEKQILRKYVNKKNLLVSTGGGVVEIKKVKPLLKSIGDIYYLDASYELLKKRTSKKGVLYRQSNPREFFLERKVKYENICDKKIEGTWDQILLVDNLK